MKHRLIIHGLLIAALSAVVPCVSRSADSPLRPASSQTNQTTQAKEKVAPARPATPDDTAIDYTPPPRGAPAVRVDGGSRGSGVSLICLTVLAPDHTGLTVHDQPSLFWYQSAPADVPFELTLIVDKQPQPILRVKLPDARKYGIQRLKLSDYNITLSPGVEYEWVVALVVDPESRSKDVIASGYIKRVAPSESLSARLANASEAELPSVYAEEGIWYDAVETLSNLVEAHPDDASLRLKRGSLLQQVGITNAAAYARSPLSGN